MNDRHIMDCLKETSAVVYINVITPTVQCTGIKGSDVGRGDIERNSIHHPFGSHNRHVDYSAAQVVL